MGNLVDHHVHIFSPESKALLEKEIGRALPPFTVKELLTVLEDDRVDAAAVLSVGYLFDHGEGGESHRRLSQENDWVARQLETAPPNRLVGMFSVNPLSPRAEDELTRCIGLDVFGGVKLHLANSQVQLANAAHAQRVRSVLRLATDAHLPVVVHLRTDADSYGADHVRIFLEDVLSGADECSLQVAHAAGWGGFDDTTASALDELVRAVGGGRFPNLQIDLSAVVRRRRPDEPPYSRLAEQLRELGLGRVLFGTDWPDWTPRGYLADLQAALPLTSDEFERITANRAPYFSAIGEGPG